jgi:hypothetical protein
MMNMLDATSINQPCNGFLLDAQFAIAYDRFEVSLEEVGPPPADATDSGAKSRPYRVVTANPNLFSSFSRPVGEPFVFGHNQDSPGTALPDPAFIRLHRAINGIIQACRAGEVIARIRRDEEEMVQPWSKYSLSVSGEDAMDQAALYRVDRLLADPVHKSCFKQLYTELGSKGQCCQAFGDWVL